MAGIRQDDDLVLVGVSALQSRVEQGRVFIDEHLNVLRPLQHQHRSRVALDVGSRVNL